jgi:hypothetical protein
VSKEEVGVEIHIIRNFTNCAFQEMLLECLTEKGLDWRDMKHAWGNETLCYTLKEGVSWFYLASPDKSQNTLLEEFTVHFCHSLPTHRAKKNIVN